MLETLLLWLTVAFVVVNFLVDIFHGVIDPRLRSMERAA